MFIKGVHDSFLKTMAEQKSKYLVWLETLHREYTERTCITLFGRQAASLHLLADMYEVRCRFEKLLNMLQSKAIQLNDEDVNYQKWYNPEKWNVNDSTFQDEDIRETFGFSPDSPLAQTYANTMLTPFGKGANFNSDLFRNVVSSLFVLNTIVDEQKMEVAINSELEKLQKVLLDISNAKNRKKDPEEYAAWFDSERLKYRRNFIIRSQLKAEHEAWKKSIYDDDYKEALRERRLELLLELFDSGFLDDLKCRMHHKAVDMLGFKNYEFDKWSDRMDDAVRYFATMNKICPFKDDMISFSDHAKIGRYILDEHIERPMINTFLKTMELILIVQKEMRTLDDPNYEEVEEVTSTEVFIEKVKRLFLLMEDENGTTMKQTNKGNGGEYKFDVKGKALCDVMDDVLENNEQYIKAYLDGANTETAVQLKYVCPFIGYILDTHLYSTDKLQKNHLKPMFKKEYGPKTSATLKMGHENMSYEAKNLFHIVKETMEKHLKARKTQLAK